MSSKRRNSRAPASSGAMPLILIAGGILLAGGALWAVLGRPAAPQATPEVVGAPSLKADKEKVDLGDVRLGNTVEVSFQLANVGDRPLEFTEFPYVEVVEGC